MNTTDGLKVSEKNDNLKLHNEIYYLTLQHTKQH
jgi:hypothetical protein